MSSSGLGVQVELGACRIVRDDKGKFTTYTLNFRIGEETHSFTSRYNKLLKFHESLLKNDEFQKSFNYNPPEFPSKSWFTDFTKPKNYKKRANKILKYFRILTSRPSILRNEQFQKGIDLSAHLQKCMSQIAKGLQSRKYIEKNYNKSLHHSPRSKSSTPPISNKLSKAQKVNKRNAQASRNNGTTPSMPTSGDDDDEIIDGGGSGSSAAAQWMASSSSAQKHAYGDGSKLNRHMMTRDGAAVVSSSSSSLSAAAATAALDESKLETLLSALAMQTDKLLVDVLDGEESKHQAQVFEDVTEMSESNKQMMLELRLFDVCDVLPSYLREPMDATSTMRSCEETAAAVDIMQCAQIMSKKELDEIDDIALDIRDAIINACEIAI